jgi:hypothetical protein
MYSNKLTGKYILDFFVNYHIYFDTPLCSCLQHTVKPVLFIIGRRPSQIKLWAQPPIQDPNLTLGFFERQRYGPEICTAIDKPFGAILRPWRGKAVIPVVYRIMQCVAEVVQMCMRMHFGFKFATDLSAELLCIRLEGVESILGAID